MATTKPESPESPPSKTTTVTKTWGEKTRDERLTSAKRLVALNRDLEHVQGCVKELNGAPANCEVGVSINGRMYYPATEIARQILIIVRQDHADQLNAIITEMDSL